MVMRPRLLFVLLLFACLNLLSLPASAENISGTLEFDEMPRTYYLHVPDTLDTTQPVPLVVALHPLASSGRALAALSGLDAAADERGFIALYPDNVGFYWDDYRGDVNLPPARGEIDDVGYLAALIDHIASKYPVDATQVYLAGWANGGTMAYRALCELPERFAGAMITGALLWSYQPVRCPENAATTPPTKLLLINGTADHLYPTEGRVLEDIEARILSLDETIDFWAVRLGCQDSEKNANITTYACGANIMAQVFVTNGGNNWFRRSDSHVLNQFGFDTTALTMAFFFDDDWQTAATQDAGEYAKARTYNLYIPPNYDPETPTPLVMMLHGKTANGASQAYVSDMNSIAAREGFIVIYPDGIDNQWNYGRGWRIYPDLPENEEAFLGGLLDDLALDLNIDASRVYVGGLSNGGFMTQRLACTLRERFAAYASVGATAPYGIVEECEGKPTVPLMFIHGTADPSVPWTGTTIEYGMGEIYTTLPMEVTATFWAEHNGCAKRYDTVPLPMLGDSPDTLTYIFQFEACPATAPLMIYAVNGGGHVWHGSPVYRGVPDSMLGVPSFDFNSSEVIWEFFKGHTLSDK